MNRLKFVLPVFVISLLASGCSGLPINDGTPESDGPPMLSECIEPYLVATVAVLMDEEDPLYAEGLYAEGRILNIVVSGVTLDGVPMTYTDYETGEQTEFFWQATHVTGLLDPYTVCVEYEFQSVEALKFDVLLSGMPNDWMSLEVESYLDDTRNLCISPFGDFDLWVTEYAQATIDVGSNTTNVGCIVPLV